MVFITLCNNYNYNIIIKTQNFNKNSITPNPRETRNNFSTPDLHLQVASIDKHSYRINCDSACYNYWLVIHGHAR